MGHNPSSTRCDAAERGVRLRVALNGAYLDDDMQDVVDLLNEDWNATQGHDVAAVIMSAGDNVNKLHNKGAIIDGTSVLVSSINWGDSAMLRNRKWVFWCTTRHWLRSITRHGPRTGTLDANTDTDNDGLLDAWEVEHDLNRARRSAPGNLIEAELVPDGDGLDHLEEFNLGSDEQQRHGRRLHS